MIILAKKLIARTHPRGDFLELGQALALLLADRPWGLDGFAEWARRVSDREAGARPIRT